MHDGDTINCTVVLSDEANAEIANYLNGVGFLVGVDGRLTIGLNSDLCNKATYNFSRRPFRKDKK